MTTATLTDVQTASARFRALEDGVNERVVERRREVKGAIIAILARAHHLQLGPPGTGKTYLVETLMSLISDAKYCSALLHGYSVMEDLYGPISLKALDEDRYLRKTDLYIPWADFFFGDEVFKASPTLLNTNLWAFNERRFKNDGRVVDIPLTSGFFASNEGPEDPILQAFDDRISLRYEVLPIKEAANRIAMFRARLARGAQSKPEPVVSMEQIHEAHRIIAQIEVPEGVLEALNDLWDDLSREQITVTDRKIADALPVIQATTFYNGRTTATIEDMKMLRDMLWTNPKDRPKVGEKVDELASPLDKEAQTLAQDIEGLAAQVEDIIGIESKAVRVRRGVQLYHKMEASNGELRDLRNRAKASNMQSEAADEARRRLHSLTLRLLRKGFRVTGDLKALSQQQLLELIKSSEEGNDDG